MEKITKGHPLSQSPDMAQQNIEILKQLFPTIVKEGKIDMEELKALLGEEIETGEEYYRFTWAGKSEARREANKPSTATLRPCKEESKNWDTTGNIFIEGDNLEVLKLLQKSYAGKIKIIYIDPPYNTGNDFVYKDNYSDNLGNYLAMTRQTDEEGRKLSTNTESDGRYHSNWLNMMYPRLKLARNLLKENGVIFVSIGVEEFANLEKIMAEIFGEDNFVEVFSWVKTSTPPGLSSKSRKTNEYIICYEIYKNGFKYNGELLDGGDQPLLNSGNSIKELLFKNETVYFSENTFINGIYSPCKTDRVELIDEITINNGYSTTDFRLKGEFKWTQEFLNEEVEKGTKFIIKSEKLSIRFIRDEDGYKRPTNFIKEKYTSPVINKTINDVGTNESASGELTDLMGCELFSYPKPVSLIKYLINFIADEGDIVMDFFAGSGTTGTSTFNWASENGKSLKFIMVQFPENLDENLKTADKNLKKLIQNGIDFLDKLGRPHLITELAKVRISRSGDKIVNEILSELEKLKKTNKGKMHQDEVQEEIERLQQIVNNLDIGFKVFKLDSSNIKAWDGNVESFEEQLKMNIEDNVKPDRSEADVLYEVLLKYGLDLTVPIEEMQVGNCKVYSVGGGVLFTCLSDKITTEVAKAIGQWKEELQPITCRVLFKDTGFNDDVAKTNSIQILRQFGIEEVNSI